jgi:hypothetical protein
VIDSWLRDRLHDRRFVVADNPEGLSGRYTVFHYLIHGADIVGTYEGGRIRLGRVLGRARSRRRIELLYHCIGGEDQLLAGWSHGEVGVDEAGLTTLTFTWGWLSGASGGGTSLHREVREIPRTDR